MPNSIPTWATIVQLSAGGAVPTSLTGFTGKVYPIKNTRTA